MELNKSQKILIIIKKLNQIKKNQLQKVTVEDVAVNLWKKYPKEFCMKGYPEYPNVDIQKYITKLFDNSYIKGGVFDYKITSKGIDEGEKLEKLEKGEISEEKLEKDNEVQRYIKKELLRIQKTKIFSYFKEDSNLEILETDIFEFLGSSPRSLATKNRNLFLTRLNMIKEVIKYCENKDNSDLKLIFNLWEKLQPNLNKLLEVNK